MDSAGLGALIGGIRRAREAGGDVAVACSRPTLTRLLHTTGFDRIVPVTETVEEARRRRDRQRRPLRTDWRLASSIRIYGDATPERRKGQAKRWVPTSVEAVEVVHVGAQERHADHRRRARRVRPGPRGAPPRATRRGGSRRGWRRARRGRCRRACAPARAPPRPARRRTADACGSR